MSVQRHPVNSKQNCFLKLFFKCSLSYCGFFGNHQLLLKPSLTMGFDSTKVLDSKNLDKVSIEEQLWDLALVPQLFTKS